MDPLELMFILRSKVLAIIGEQFDVNDEICGAVLSIRSSEDIISVWNKTSSNGRINLKIRYVQRIDGKFDNMSYGYCLLQGYHQKSSQLTGGYGDGIQEPQ